MPRPEGSAEATELRHGSWQVQLAERVFDHPVEIVRRIDQGSLARESTVETDRVIAIAGSSFVFVGARRKTAVPREAGAEGRQVAGLLESFERGNLVSAKLLGRHPVVGIAEIAAVIDLVAQWFGWEIGVKLTGQVGHDHFI